MKRRLQFARCFFAVLLGALCVSVASLPARAQGCAMCYNAAAAAGKTAARSLDFGIVVLLSPALLMFIGVFILLIRRANHHA